MFATFANNKYYNNITKILQKYYKYGIIKYMIEGGKYGNINNNIYFITNYNSISRIYNSSN